MTKITNQPASSLPLGHFLILAAIIIFGFTIRVYRVDQNLPVLYSDEVGGNYKAWVAFNSPDKNVFSLLPKAINSYTWALGLTPLAARLPSVIYGTLALLFLYLLARSLTKDPQVPLLTAFLGAISPWLFMLSRISFSQILIIVSLVCLHFWLFVRAKTPQKYLLSLPPLFLAAYFYPSMIIIAPIMTLLTGYEIFKVAAQKQKKLAIPLAVLGLLALTGILFGKYNGLSIQSRGIDMAIWRDVNVTSESDTYRGLSRLSSPSVFSLGKPTETISNKLLFNYPLSVFSTFIKNYFSFFSLDFLFLKGDTTLRQSTGMTGSFYLAFLPFLLYGVYLFTKSGDLKVKRAVFLWILVSPLPGAITKDGPGYLLRVVTMMPFLTYLTAFGLSEIYKNYLSKQAFVTRVVSVFTIALTIIFSAYLFLFGYFHIYPTLAAQNFEFGFKELSDFQVSHQNQPLLVIWDGYYPDTYFRFWQKTPPREYLGYSPRDITVGKSTFHQMFPNLYFSLPYSTSDLNKFLSDNKIPHLAVRSDFLKKNPEYRHPDKDILEVIKYPDGTDDFTIYYGL